MGDAPNADHHVKMEGILEEIIHKIKEIQDEHKEEHLRFGASLDKYNKLEEIKNKIQREITGENLQYNPNQLELNLYNGR